MVSISFCLRRVYTVQLWSINGFYVGNSCVFRHFWNDYQILYPKIYNLVQISLSFTKYFRPPVTYGSISHEKSVNCRIHTLNFQKLTEKKIDHVKLLAEFIVCKNACSLFHRNKCVNWICRSENAKHWIRIIALKWPKFYLKKSKYKKIQIQNPNTLYFQSICGVWN